MKKYIKILLAVVSMGVNLLLPVADEPIQTIHPCKVASVNDGVATVVFAGAEYEFYADGVREGETLDVTFEDGRVVAYN